MSNDEIAARTGMSKHHVEQLIYTGLRKIANAGDLDTFALVIHLTALARIRQGFIRCGSIECRPEKWVFYAGR